MKNIQKELRKAQSQALKESMQLTSMMLKKSRESQSQVDIRKLKLKIGNS